MGEGNWKSENRKRSMYHLFWVSFFVSFLVFQMVELDCFGCCNFYQIVLASATWAPFVGLPVRCLRWGAVVCLACNSAALLFSG